MIPAGLIAKRNSRGGSSGNVSVKLKERREGEGKRDRLEQQGEYIDD